MLEILARQNDTLEQLAVNSDTIMAPLARDRLRVAGAIRHSSNVAKATAERRGELADDIQTLPKFLDEKVAAFHLEKVGAKLTKLSPQQAEYIGVTVPGPYKHELYRY